LEDCLPQYEFQYWSCAEKKGYAGTAIFSKVKPLSVQHEIVPESKPDNEGRYIALEFEKYWLVHTYVSKTLTIQFNSIQSIILKEYRKLTVLWGYCRFQMRV
jgi:exonuclease III